MTNSHNSGGGFFGSGRRRISTETKASYKTSELPIYIVIVLGILIASAVTDDSDFGAQEAWHFITLLTIGYLLSRGLAKLGSREYFDEDANEGRGGHQNSGGQQHGGGQQDFGGQHNPGGQHATPPQYPGQPGPTG